MRGISVYLFCLFLAFCHAPFATPKAGNMEGMRVESLPALAMPVVLGSEDILDWAAPLAFQKKGDWAKAADLWQNLADHARATDKERALLGLGRALEHVSGPAAAKVYLNVTNLNPKHAEAWARLAPLSTHATLKPIEAGLLALPLNDIWRAEGLLALVWQEAGRGPISQTYGLSKARELALRVADVDARVARREAIAFWLGFLPGFGHAYAGDSRTAAVILPLWALFAWAVLFALRRREWPYALIWLLALGAIWFQSPVSAKAVAHAEGVRLRAEALASWNDLKPRWPEDAPAPKPLLPESSVASEDLPSVSLVSRAVVLPSASLVVSATSGVSASVLKPAPTGKK